MAKILEDEIKTIEDPQVRKVLEIISDELFRIKKLPPVAEDLKQIALTLNKVTGNL